MILSLYILIFWHDLQITFTSIRFNSLELFDSHYTFKKKRHTLIVDVLPSLLHQIDESKCTEIVSK